MAIESNRDEELPLLSEPRLRPSVSNGTSQVAIVGSNVCPIESLDYKIIENYFLKQDWRSQGKFLIVQYVFMKWALCFLLGVITNLVGFFNNLAVENIAGLKFVVTSNMMLESKFLMAFGVFAASNLVLILLSSIIMEFMAPKLLAPVYQKSRLI